MQPGLFEPPEQAEKRWRDEQESAKQRIRQRLAWHRQKVNMLYMKLAMLDNDADPLQP